MSAKARNPVLAVEHCIYVGDVGRAGKGLICGGYIPEKYIVAQMHNTKIGRFSEAEAYVREQGLPEDARVKGARGNIWYYDKTFSSLVTAPMWYMLNHACEPNCEMFVLDNVLSFRTIRAVRNEELSFAYGEPNPQWCRCEGVCYTKKWHLA